MGIQLPASWQRLSTLVSLCVRSARFVPTSQNGLDRRRRMGYALHCMRRWVAQTAVACSSHGTCTSRPCAGEPRVRNPALCIQQKIFPKPKIRAHARFHSLFVGKLLRRYPLYRRAVTGMVPYRPTPRFMHTAPRLSPRNDERCDHRCNTASPFTSPCWALLSWHPVPLLLRGLHPQQQHLPP